MFPIRVSSRGLERILPHQLDDAGNRIIRPATGYAIEPAASISAVQVPMRLPGGRPSRRSHVQEPRSRPLDLALRVMPAGARGVAVDRARPDGDRSENTAAATAEDDQSWSAAP